jgi:ferredoxin-nitrite reductase
VQDSGFTEDQKQYLEGYIAALVKKRSAELPTVSSSLRANAQASSTQSAELQLKDPAFIHIAAQDRWVEGGGKLVPEEVAKRAKHPFDIWDEMLANAAAGRFPKGTDIFLHKFHGLFYVAPNQHAFMLRLRLPGGIVSSHQAKGLGSVAERFGGGYLHVTTRANLQVREIGATHTTTVLTAIDELGLTSRGAGADNIRNLTGSPLWASIRSS